MEFKRIPRLGVTLSEHYYSQTLNQKLVLKGEIYTMSSHQKVFQQQANKSSLIVDTILSLNI
jgi:hypothetical protein